MRSAFLLIVFGAFSTFAQEDLNLCKRKPYLAMCQDEASNFESSRQGVDDTAKVPKNLPGKADVTVGQDQPSDSMARKKREISTAQRAKRGYYDGIEDPDYLEWRARRARLMRRLRELDQDYGYQRAAYRPAYQTASSYSSYYYPQNYYGGYSRYYYPSYSYYPSSGSYYSPSYASYWPSGYGSGYGGGYGGYGGGYGGYGGGFGNGWPYASGGPGQFFNFGIGRGLSIGLPYGLGVGVGSGLGVSVG